MWKFVGAWALQGAPTFMASRFALACGAAASILPYDVFSSYLIVDPYSPALTAPRGWSSTRFWAGYGLLFLIEAATVFTNDRFDYDTDSNNLNWGPFNGGSRALLSGGLTAHDLRLGSLFALAGAVIAGNRTCQRHRRSHGLWRLLFSSRRRLHHWLHRPATAAVLPHSRRNGCRPDPQFHGHHGRSRLSGCPRSSTLDRSGSLRRCFFRYCHR